MLTINDSVSIMGGSNKVNFIASIVNESEKAFCFEAIDTLGSHLHEYNITFWLPKSICFKNLRESNGFGSEIILPFWFTVIYNKSLIR